jgi:hypothetical protein
MRRLSPISWPSPYARPALVCDARASAARTPAMLLFTPASPCFPSPHSEAPLVRKATRLYGVDPSRAAHRLVREPLDTPSTAKVQRLLDSPVTALIPPTDSCIDEAYSRSPSYKAMSRRGVVPSTPPPHAPRLPARRPSSALPHDIFLRHLQVVIAAAGGDTPAAPLERETSRQELLAAGRTMVFRSPQLYSRGSSARRTARLAQRLRPRQAGAPRPVACGESQRACSRSPRRVLGHAR